MNEYSLFFALLLSREHKAAKMIEQPLWGYQLTVEQQYDTYYTFSIIHSDAVFAEDEATPHVKQQFTSVDNLVAFLDDHDVPFDGWFPVEKLPEEEVQEE